MSDTCTVTRASSGSPTLDPVTGLPTAGARTAVYGGKCRVRSPGTISNGSRRDAGADQALLLATILSVPASAARLVVDDRVEITASVNPTLVGSVWTVSGLVPSSHMTAQRVQVTAVID